MMVLAVTLHNIPEGMAVGVMYAGFLAGNAADHRSKCFGIVPRHRYSELPRRRNHLDAASSGRDEQKEGIRGWRCFRHRRAIGAVLTIIASQLIIAARLIF